MSSSARSAPLLLRRLAARVNGTERLHGAKGGMGPPYRGRPPPTAPVSEEFDMYWGESHVLGDETVAKYPNVTLGDIGLFMLLPISFFAFMYQRSVRKHFEDPVPWLPRETEQNSKNFPRPIYFSDWKPENWHRWSGSADEN